MKLYTFTIWMVVVLVGTMCRAEVSALEDEKPIQGPKVAITLSSDQEEILPCTPLGVTVVLENISAEPVEKIGSRWSSYRFRKEDEKKIWHIYMICGLHAHLPPPNKMTLFPQKPFKDTYTMHVNFRYEPILKDPGVYYVQCGTPFGQSEQLKVTVVLPETSIDAYKIMYDKKIFMLFHDYTADCYLERKGNIDDLAKGLQEFKETAGYEPYSDWITCAEFILKKARIKLLPDSERATLYDNLASEYEPIADKLPSPQKENLLMALATMQKKNSRTEAELRLLQKVISAQAYNYSEIQARYLYNLYDK